MDHDQYPALFLDADSSANRYQRQYLWLIRGEYSVLLLAAIFSMGFLDGIVFNLVYAFLFVVGLVLLIVRALSRPEQSWYRCRALAESVKTLCWRYMMHATPFEQGNAKKRLREELHRMFHENLETARQITEDWSGDKQITGSMEQTFLLSLEDRRNYYLNHRVEQQRCWYRDKARSNRKASRIWVWISGFCYVTAGIMVLARIAYPLPLLPLEPIIVIAASIVGWMQIRKFNELSASYTVTAHEIGLIPSMSDLTKGEVEFSEFVNDAEMAFSREHTLWLARQSD